MCGSGHYSMKGLIIVETQEEYDSWIATQKPQYLTVKSAETEAAPKPATDTLKTTAVNASEKPIALNTQH
jgi:cytochrome c oxidase subunit 2